ncbi:nuclease-related domain-containing protein [Pectobacterium parmentieri]|uniref:nuclease-related domain-containing protein n=1 Tax=Pectobacterium parmentieri TaxID=1905730 RepID=UPI001269519E|nr:nuclease-related domain-containing protein [Pectobacterium parmentieri]
MELDVQTQCWAVIECALRDGYYLQGLMEDHIQNIGRNKKPFSLNNKNITTQDGESFSPDSSLDKIVQFLTLTLKMFSYEHNLLSSGEIIIPSKIGVEEPVVSNATEVFYCSLLWHELITCAKSCILFDNNIQIAKVEEIPDFIKEKGIDSGVLFNRTIDKFERYDAISNERLSRRLSQNLWEGIASSNIERIIPKYVTGWSGTLDNPILLEEFQFLISLMEAIASHDKDHMVLGLSLREWVRGYSVIAYLSKEIKQKVLYTKGELMSMLRLGGFKEKKAETFIKHITFGDDSRDLYDSPLVKISDYSFFLYTPAYTSPLISNIILSKFSSKQADLTKKGYGFEKDIIEILNDKKLENRSFKFKRGNDEFEYDVIFLLDDKVFILECKNTNLSGGSVTRAYQKKKFIFDTALQVKRLVVGLTSHPEVFKEHFDKDIGDYEIIPVIMNNLPFSIPGSVDGVFVTDSSSFGRLLRSRYINSGIISHQDEYRITDHNPVFSMWESDTLKASDIINHFNNPVQLQDFIKYEKTGEYPLIIKQRKVFFNVVTETDYDTMNVDQSDYFVKTQSVQQI